MVVIVRIDNGLNMAPFRWAKLKNLVRLTEKWYPLLLIIMIFLLIVIFGARRLTEKNTFEDAVQNSTIVYNLAYHSTYSQSVDGDLLSTFHREPVPNFFWALHVKLHPSLATGLTPESLWQGSAARTLKQHNLIWGFFALLGVSLVTRLLIENRLLHLVMPPLAVLVTYVAFLKSSVIDRTATELHAGTLTIWLSLFLLLAFNKKLNVWFLLSGVILGGIILTKSHYLYVGVGLFIVLVLLFIVKKHSLLNRNQAILKVSFLGIGSLLVVLPWSIRNYIQFNTYELTDRAGPVILLRSYYNDVDILGAFYYFSPELLKANVGSVLGYSEEDSDIGGSLLVLNRNHPIASASDVEVIANGEPENAMTYYGKMMAERGRLLEYYLEGGDDPTIALYRAKIDMQDEAMQRIQENPVKHLAMSVVFMWRGMWWGLDTMSIRGKIFFLINIMAFLSIWTMALVGLWKRHPVMISIAVVPVGAMSFLALTSHYLPRYSDPMIPNMVVALVVGIAWSIEWFVSANRRRLGRANKQHI